MRELVRLVGFLMIVAGLMILFGGCSSQDEAFQAEFVPTTDAALASTATYDEVYLIYPRKGNDIFDKPKFVVTGSVAYVIPIADQQRLENRQPGATLALPTLSMYDLVEHHYGFEAADSLVLQVEGTKEDPVALDNEKPAKLLDTYRSLTANVTAYDAFAAVKCYNQRIKSGPAQLEILQQRPVVESADPKISGPTG